VPFHGEGTSIRYVAPSAKVPVIVVVAAWAGTARHTSASVKTNIRLKREFISFMGMSLLLAELGIRRLKIIEVAWNITGEV
jgi:predicted GTPase